MATYYVESGHGGSDAGTLENPWLLIDTAMNNVAAGDKVWVKASANYTETVTIDTVGSNDAPIVFEGYDSSTGDGGRATIHGGATRANGIVDAIPSGSVVLYVFKNFRITNHTGDGFSATRNKLTFKNCKFDDNGTDGTGSGISVGVGDTYLFERCEFSANKTHGANLGYYSVFIGCKFGSNGSKGIRCNGGLTAVFCTFFSEPDTSIEVHSGNAVPTVLINCTIDGDSKDTTLGFERAVAYSAPVVVVNTILYDCETGMLWDGGERNISLNNCVNANTLDYSATGDAQTFSGEVTDAPEFVNEVGGADYTPSAGSPLLEAGYDIDPAPGMDIGAIQKIAPVASAGGGGKRGGKQV